MKKVDLRVTTADMAFRYYMHDDLDLPGAIRYCIKYSNGDEKELQKFYNLLIKSGYCSEEER